MTKPPLIALVVEDDANVVEFIRRTMIVLGHDCICATNVQDAREALRRGGLDYILLDLKIPALPDGLFPSIDCGMTFLAEIGNERGNGHMPVFVMTSYTDQGFGMAVKLANMGASRCIPKPLDDKPLSQIIQEVLADHNGHAASGDKSAQPTAQRRPPKACNTAALQVPAAECYAEIDVRSADKGFLCVLLNKNAGGRPTAACEPIPLEGQLLAILVAGTDAAIRRLREAEEDLSTDRLPEELKAVIEWTQDSLRPHVNGDAAAGRQAINRLRRMVKFQDGAGLVAKQDADGMWRTTVRFRIRATPTMP